MQLLHDGGFLCITAILKTNMLRDNPLNKELLLCQKRKASSFSIQQIMTKHRLS